MAPCPQRAGNVDGCVFLLAATRTGVEKQKVLEPRILCLVRVTRSLGDWRKGIRSRVALATSFPRQKDGDEEQCK